jgi:hypothetical protein
MIMTFKSTKLTDYIMNTRQVALNDAHIPAMPDKNKIHLTVFPQINLFKNMFVRTFTAKEIATMILNENNPKTMDYYFMKLLGVTLENACLSYGGALHGTLKAKNGRITESFGVLCRVRNYERGQIYFVMDIHEAQIFPKSRSFRITSRRLLPIPVNNPKAGQKKQITYGSGYVSNYIEPTEILVPKHLVLYCRNAWERKGEVKPSRVKNNNDAPDATAEAVSVI